MCVKHKSTSVNLLLTAVRGVGGCRAMWAAQQCVCVCQLALEERRELDIAAATGLCILQKMCIETASNIHVSILIFLTTLVARLVLECGK